MQQDTYLYPVPCNASGQPVKLVCDEAFIVVAADSVPYSVQSPNGTFVYYNTPVIQPVYGLNPLEELHDSPFPVRGVSAAGFECLQGAQFARPGDTVLFAVRFPSSCLYVLTRSATPPRVTLEILDYP